MSQSELNLWSSYVEENGPLNLALRIESAIARAVAPFFKNTTPRALMVWPKEAAQPASPEQILGFLTEAARTNKKD